MRQHILVRREDDADEQLIHGRQMARRLLVLQRSSAAAQQLVAGSLFYTFTIAQNMTTLLRRWPVWNRWEPADKRMPSGPAGRHHSSPAEMDLYQLQRAEHGVGSLAAAATASSRSGYLRPGACRPRAR